MSKNDTTTDGSTNDVSRDELQRRVIYSFLVPAARLAKRFRIPLKEMTGWLQLAYFQEVRSSGLTLREAGALLDVGMRKASQLSKSLKSNFFDPERQHGLPRRIEFMVWGEPHSRARIQQILRQERASQIDDAIALLIEERRITEVKGRPDVFEASSTQARLYRPDWMSQIDGVNNFLTSCLTATYSRVFHHSPQSLLRTLNFRIRESDIEELHKFYQEELFPRLAALEQAAAGAPDATTMDLSICWSPASEDLNIIPDPTDTPAKAAATESDNED